MTGVFRHRFRARPKRWMPFSVAADIALPITDDFSGGGAGSIDARTMSDGSHTWSVEAGDVDNDGSERVVGGAAGASVAICDNAPDTADVEVTTKLVAGDSLERGGVVARYTDGNNLYLAHVAHGSTPWELRLYVATTAGGFVQIDDTTHTITAGQSFGIRCETKAGDDEISLLKDTGSGFQVLEMVPDGEHSTGAMGLRFYGQPDFTLDDFSATVYTPAAGGIVVLRRRLEYA